MIYRQLITLSLSLIILSCREGSTPLPTGTTEAQEDKIVYTDIDPNEEIQTVRLYTPQPNNACETSIPVPTDSTVFYEMDLDNDQTIDFKLKVTHSEYTVAYCGHCRRFTYNIIIEGISEKDSIAITSSPYRIYKSFNHSDTINVNNSWAPKAEILLLESCSVPFQTDIVDGYIGVKINNSYGYIRIEKISNNGIRILDHGFNKTENNQIICGQTQ